MKSVLNIHWKDWCWNSNTLATWWEELTHWKRPWCWETLKAGRVGDERRRWLDGIPDLMDMSLSKILELVMDRKAWHAVVHRVTKSWTMTEQLNSSKKLTMHIDNGHFYLTSGLWANFPVFYISESMMLIKFNIKCLFSD